MAKIDFETVCLCGQKLTGQMKKPTLLTKSIRPIKCSNCGSRYLMTSARINGVQGRLMNTNIEIIEISARAEELFNNKPSSLGRALLEIVGISKPDTSAAIVETEMDTPAE